MVVGCRGPCGLLLLLSHVGDGRRPWWLVVVVVIVVDVVIVGGGGGHCMLVVMVVTCWSSSLVTVIDRAVGGVVRGVEVQIWNFNLHVMSLVT